jgi:hypothetical protein
LDQQTRLISFRVTEGQYERLRFLSSSYGAKSISRFVRWSITQLISNAERTVLDLLGMPAKVGTGAHEELRDELAAELPQLDRKRVEEYISEAIRRLSEKVDGIDRELHDWRQRREEEALEESSGSQPGDSDEKSTG